MINNFVIFICSHGRASTLTTVSALISCGYTGKYYLVVDNTDFQIQEYINLYGADNVIIFDKQHYIDSTDIVVNRPIFNAAVYARRAIEDIARNMNLNSFAVADDDITNFVFRWPQGNSLKSKKILDLDSVLGCLENYLITGNIACVGVGIAKDYIKGKSVLDSVNMEKSRIPYNFIIRNGKFQIDYFCWYSEDTLTCIKHQEVDSQYWIQIFYVEAHTKEMGNNAGGMAIEYLSTTSYDRCILAKVINPSKVKLQEYKNKFVIRLQKENAFPKLISDIYRRK